MDRRVIITKGGIDGKDDEREREIGWSRGRREKKIGREGGILKSIYSVLVLLDVVY